MMCDEVMHNANAGVMHNANEGTMHTASEGTMHNASEGTMHNASEGTMHSTTSTTSNTSNTSNTSTASTTSTISTTSTASTTSNTSNASNTSDASPAPTLHSNLSLAMEKTASLLGVAEEPGTLRTRNELYMRSAVEAPEGTALDEAAAELLEALRGIGPLSTLMLSRLFPLVCRIADDHRKGMRVLGVMLLRELRLRVDCATMQQNGITAVALSSLRANLVWGDRDEEAGAVGESRVIEIGKDEESRVIGLDEEVATRTKITHTHRHTHSQTLLWQSLQVWVDLLKGMQGSDRQKSADDLLLLLLREIALCDDKSTLRLDTLLEGLRLLVRNVLQLSATRFLADIFETLYPLLRREAATETFVAVLRVGWVRVLNDPERISALAMALNGVANEHADTARRMLTLLADENVFNKAF
jgi:hypothetical protein